MKLTSGGPLPAGAIAHAAWNDLCIRELKRTVRDSEQHVIRRPVYELGVQYCFHRKHVSKALGAVDLIKRAIAEPLLGQASGKPNTRLVYSDVSLLERALEVASQRYG